MKKFFAIFAALLLTASFAFAVEPSASSTGPWNADDMLTNGKIEGNDYSFDNAQGEYKIFVICQIDIANVTGNIYLGWLNPDGAKDLGTAYNMQFKVTGGNGWPFEANATFGAAGSNATNAFACDEQNNDQMTNNVFITGSTWTYQPEGGTLVNITGQQWTNQKFALSGTMGMFGTNTSSPKIGDNYGGGRSVVPTTTPEFQTNAAIKEFWVKCGDCCPSNACQGKGIFTLTPGTVWASPDATEGFYTFPIYVEVDYLTFKSAANYYYTGSPNPADPSAFSLTTQP